MAFDETICGREDLGTLQSGCWGGRVDILRRIERPSELGSWSYEVMDTKLARETKGNTVLQICLYSDVLADAQKITPEFAYVVTPNSGYEPQEFRIADYAAYYRLIRRSLERVVTCKTELRSYARQASEARCSHRAESRSGE
jgi:predicted RecB family nuclease